MDIHKLDFAGLHFCRDPLTGRWVVIMPTDSKKIFENSQKEFRPHKPEEDIKPEWCRYCHPKNGETYDDIYSSGGIRVTTKKDTHVRVTGPLNKEDDGIYDCKTAFGIYETVIIGNQHPVKLSELTTALFANSLEVCRNRIADLNRDTRLEDVLIWADGNNMATGRGFVHPLWHIHSTTHNHPRIIEEMARCYEYYYLWEKYRCLLCDMIRGETNNETRIVKKTDNFIAFVPHSARYPLETWIAPIAHYSYFEEIAADQNLYHELAKLIQAILKSYESLLGSRVPFLLSLHNGPKRFSYKSPDRHLTLAREEILNSFHLKFRLKPRSGYGPAFEEATGENIVRILPNVAAECLRSALE